ncbi:MAG: tRNA epoxyqueuosine(34) reductase QueG [Alphaproteobacteria bacterium]|nr:tRNA epoxyqueuosine(34) reductase QueG [Alphaproteobacteria bacterium]
MANLRHQLRQAALAEGFDAVGFAAAVLSDKIGENLRAFLAAGWHGDMGWLETRANERAHPQNLWPEAQTVMMVGHNYAPDFDPEIRLAQKDQAVISVYAQNRDYHDVMKRKLRKLAGVAAKLLSCDVKIFVDTAPVMEKPLGVQAGLGWQGKHTNLVSRQFGSYLFLGSVFLAADVPHESDDNLSQNQPHADNCGSCSACLTACPTQAFPAPYRLNATRCLSYLTIEHKGVIPREFRVAMGNRIYGCDSCLAVCPWNKFSLPTVETAYLATPERFGDSKSGGNTAGQPLLAELVTLNDAEFRKLFAGSPIKRIGHTRFLRNVLIALGNSGQSNYAPIVATRLGDDSALVRGGAIWALARLSRDALHQAALIYRTHETDETVIEEWRHELSESDQAVM